MTIQKQYKDQVELLLNVLPVVQEEQCFGLKGGTAINLFHRDMPRLSVDIDLAYLEVEPRGTFLGNLTQAMMNITQKLKNQKLDVVIKRSGGHIIKLLVGNHHSTIKIEPNTILRGYVFEPILKELSQNAQNIFLQTQKAKLISIPDLYAGKICAALDRQHPRDLFDIKLLFENEGVTNEIRQAFVVYLASSPRPMNELLSPNEIDMKEVFQKEFVGMTDRIVKYDELCDVRKSLIKGMQQSLSLNEKNFLISLKSGSPQWDLLPIPHVSKLPAVQWKLLNIQKMDSDGRNQALNKLRSVLEVI